MAENAPHIPDQAQRDRIATDLDTTFLVEAAAGTGKTTCLIARMVGLLCQGKCSIGTLAAVTFTRKAAAELRTRFQLALELAAADASGPEGQRLKAALDHVDRCFIGTIHSFCARLLRERPVEAGIDPSFIELDETLDAQLCRQAWREHVATMITTDAPVLPELADLGLRLSADTRRSNALATELDELGLEPAELGPAFLKFAEHSDVELWPAEPVPMPDLQPFIQQLSEYTTHMRSLPLPEDPGNDKLIPKYEKIGRMSKRLVTDQPAQIMELLEEFEPISRNRLVQRNWPGGKIQALDEWERWNRFVEELSQPLLRTWREHRYSAVMRAIRPAIDVYERLRRERNGLNFQDLLVHSVRLLRDKPEVRNYFRKRFTHVLIDEFQDTDPIQAEVLLLLTADDPAETDWQACRPVHGSLFVVGDPKQSIYRFRRADILVYSKVRSIIEAAGGDVLPLTANFRSVGPMLSWVNTSFTKIFPAQANEFRPANRPMDVGRADNTDWAPTVRKLAAPDHLGRFQELAEHEAELIARSIRQAIDEQWLVPRSESELRRGVSPYARAEDFMIVARSKARLSVYARQLQKYAVPHVVTGGNVLNEVPELELLHTCLAAVSRTDDPVALVAVLRSELFGIPDTLLYEYRRRGGSFSYRAPIPDELPADEAEQLRLAFERLTTYALWMARMPAAAAIERVAADLGLIVRACASEEGDAHAGSLMKAIELLREADGQLTVGDYVDGLARLVERDEIHDGIQIRPAGEMPVRVMNLHQCKGLEAPFVFLVDPSGHAEYDVTVHIDRSGDQPRGYLPIYGRKRSQWSRPPLLAHPPGWYELARNEQKFLDAESDRLLYVAATRAGAELVVSQRDGRSNSKNPWQRLAPFLAGLEEFEQPPAMPAPEYQQLVMDQDAWSSEVSKIGERWQQVARPTYDVRSVKASALQPGPKPHGVQQHGAEWGTVMHTVLEAVIQHPHVDVRPLAVAALEAVDLPLELVDDVLTTIHSVIESTLWQRARSSRECLTEVPITRCQSPAKTGELSEVVRGVIDLVFRESAGWVLVDYKSERVESNDVAALVSYYQPQIDAYVSEWEAITGQPVAEAGLFFTHTGDYAATWPAE